MTKEEFDEIKRECEKLGIECYEHVWTADQEFMEWSICRMLHGKAGVIHCLMPLNLSER